MKITSRVSTGQYEYSEMTDEISFEVLSKMSDSTGAKPEEVAARYAKNLDTAHHAAFAEKPINTLGDKEMTDFLYNQVKGALTPTGEKNHIDTWEKMNPAQQKFIKLLKNALNRK